MKKKMVIITGCGKSGTLYMRKVFEVLGYDIGHEELRQDGISSWYIVDPHHWNITDGYINMRRNSKERERLYIHLVRNPVDVISSFYRCEALPKRAALNFFRRSTISDPSWHTFDEIKFIAKYWVEWNRAAEALFKFDEVIRVEDMQFRYMIRRLAEYCGITGLIEVENAIKEIRSLGDGVHRLDSEDLQWLQDNAEERLRNVTFEDIRNADRVIAHEVLCMAEGYGYNLNVQKDGN